jgi:hypothetical protein
VTIETDFGLCEGFCPKAYNVTTNGFCVKLHVNSKTFDDAEKQCQADGGHMMNTDSELKNADVTEFLHEFNSYIYIDGRRKDSSSEWVTVDNSPKRFFYWASGQPGGGFCIKMHHSNIYWHDSSSCTVKRPFICEI